MSQTIYAPPPPGKLWMPKPSISKVGDEFLIDLPLKIIGRHRIRYHKLIKRTGKDRTLWDYVGWNTWTNTGETSLLDAVFRGSAAPSSLDLALSNASSYSKSSSVISSESSGGGYARKTLNRNTTDWGAPTLENGFYTTTSVSKTWKASGGSISQAKFLCLMNSTQLIFFQPLPGASVIPSGASCTVTCKVAHAWIVDVGIQEILNYYFRNNGTYITGATTPSSFYVGLCGTSDTALSNSSTLTTANSAEISGGGYARQAVARSSGGWPTAATESGSYQIKSALLEFPGGTGTTWSAQSGPFAFAFLGTVSSDSTGALLAYQLLKAINDKPEGGQFNGRFRIKVF